MKNTFHLKGQIWRTVYGNRECLFQDSRGMRYIHELLALKPGQRIPSSHLVSYAIGQCPHTGSPEEMRAVIEALIKGDLAELATHRPDRIVPAEVIQSLRAAIQAKTEELERTANPAARAELAEEIKNIESCLRMAETNARFSDRSTRDRSSVKNAIKRAIKAVAEHDPDFARHLRNSIRTGYSCSYQPEKPIEWFL